MISTAVEKRNESDPFGSVPLVRCFVSVSGGAGKDLLIGGAGDDDILGDTDYVATNFDWSATDSNGVRLFNPVAGAQAPSGGGADVIYAGEGKDYVWAGAGNDVVFGEGGDDRLNGNEGNDIILGGEGNDKHCKSRRWRDGERTLRAANDSTWRRAA